MKQIIGLWVWKKGVDNSEDEVSKRLRSWSDLGCTPLIDNYQFHIGIDGYDLNRFFEGNIKQQATWKKLIRTLLVINNPNKEYQPQDIKKFQSKKWGRCDSDNCLIEIFPLPSPNANHWNYDIWSDIPILRSRESYKSALRAPRIKSLRNMIDLHKPKLVLLYGMGDEECHTLEEISKSFGVTRERIRQIETKALQKLRHPSRKHLFRDYIN